MIMLDNKLIGELQLVVRGIFMRQEQRNIMIKKSLEDLVTEDISQRVAIALLLDYADAEREDTDYLHAELIATKLK